MKRYILFNYDCYDGCSGARGIVELFDTKDELVGFIRTHLETEILEEDTISVYDIQNEIAYDSQNIWDWNEDYSLKEYWIEELDYYLNDIKE